MTIHISRREVLNNLIRFKDNLSEMQEDQDKEHRDPKKRKYKALLNQKTGDLRFAKRISFLENQMPVKSRESLSDWKEVHLLVEEKQAQVHFEILDEQGRELHARELSHLAWRIISETVGVLNQKGKGAHHEEEALQDLGSILLAPESTRIEEVAGWQGSLDRRAAEHMLIDKPVGCYLLREGDEITLSLAFHLSEEQHSFVHPYLLTFVARDEKISELLLLHTDKGWTFYSDDPDLRQPLYHYHPSIQMLIASLKAFAETPVTTRH